jgi:cytidyltransferase-like protein
VHGRFQPFHYGHLEYTLAALACCDHRIIGITNPDPSLVTVAVVLREIGATERLSRVEEEC